MSDPVVNEYEAAKQELFSLEDGGSDSDAQLSTSEAHDDVPVEEPSEESVDGLDADSREAADDKEETEQDAQSESDEADSVEYIKITDETGRKRKLKIDYSNRDHIRKAYQQAAGMRKFQAERDKARKELESVQTDLQGVNALNEAYAKGGVPALAELIGGEGAWKKLISKELAKAQIREHGSEDEVRELERQESAERERRELEALRRERDEFLKQAEQERKSSEAARTTAMIEPAFNKYRFAGKLGNADREHVLDRMVWRDAREELSALVENGTELTPALVEREFRKAAAALGETVRDRTKLAEKKRISQKRKQAAEHIQKPDGKSTRPIRGGRSKSELMDALKNKSISEIMADDDLFGAL